MAEYIEKEAAMLTPVLPKEHRRYQTSNLDDVYEQGWVDALDNLKNAPADDVAPVQYGKWTITEGMIENAVCSNCGRHFQSYYEEYRYCPNCGAEMMGETHESEKQL